MVLAWTGDELAHEQAQNGVKFDFEVKFNLEGQGQSPSKTMGILTKVFYIYGPNLVILAETSDELSRGQARDWHTDGHTHRQTQATTIPEGQYWPRVKMVPNRHCKRQLEARHFSICHMRLQHIKAEAGTFPGPESFSYRKYLMKVSGLVLYISHEKCTQFSSNILASIPGTWFKRNVIKSIWPDTKYQTWLQIFWQHSRQPIRSHSRKSLLTKMNLTRICLSNPGTRHV